MPVKKAHLSRRAEEPSFLFNQHVYLCLLPYFKQMPLSLGLYTTAAMVWISSSWSMRGAASAGAKRPVQHIEAFYAAFHCFKSGSKIAGIPTLPSQCRHERGHPRLTLHRHGTVETVGGKSWRSLAAGSDGGAVGVAWQSRDAQSHRRGRGCIRRNALFVGGSSSSASSPPPPSTTPSLSPPRNVAVLALRDSGDELERCRYLAQNLGLDLVIARGGDNEEKKQKEGKRNEAIALGDGARESSDFKFVLLFDEMGRLALDQPGSGFNPLVVNFSGGRVGHRSKHAQGKTEQVVKAAALPKHRTHSNSGHLQSTSSQKPSSSPGSSPPASGNGSGDAGSPLPLLWDLTAGLGTDAFLLAQAGWRVKMFERSPVVAALVQDALDRARVCDDETARTAASRMSLTVADSTELLAKCIPSMTETRVKAKGVRGTNVGAEPQPDVVYLDPMFPKPKQSKRKKSALAKKGMQMLQALLAEEDEEEDAEEGKEEDEDELDRTGTQHGGDTGASGDSQKAVMAEERKLFDVAMSLAKSRVVVKRPVHGEAIVEHVKPSHAVLSKNGRLDVYVVPPS